MAELTDEMKEAIVRGHAQFLSPPEIRKALLEDFGVDAGLPQIHTYHPGKRCFEAGDRWREMFEAHRKVYMEEVASHDIASPAYRIGMLDRMAKKAERTGNAKLAAELIEQAAKEMGGLFTNERRLSGTIDHRHRPATVDEARAQLKDKLARLQDKAAVTGQDVATSGGAAGQGKHGVA